MRFPAQVDSVELIIQHTAKVVDESHGGIGVMLQVPTISVGQTVNVNYNGVTMQAVVQRLEPRIDGIMFAGLEWATALID